MDIIKKEFGSVCTSSGYCIEESEVEEAIALFVFSVFLTFSSLRQIQLRNLFGKDSGYYNLKDDVFDITLLYIYGVVLLLLSFSAIKWNYDVLQTDIIAFHILLGITALYVRDSTNIGILFTCLSYSSWYGLFRLFLTNPIEENIWIMFQPQWLSALIAFSAPILIANLKYPSFIQGNLALVTYGSIFFGLLIACNTMFVFSDVFILYLELFPGYGARLSKGQNFRLYGTSLTYIHRIYYYGTMLILQLICIQLPHIFFNKENLDEQLQLQYEIQSKSRRIKQQKSAVNINNTEDEILHNIQTNKMKSMETSKINQKRSDIPILETSEEFQDLPKDCIEITVEEAIKLQERGFNPMNQSDHTLHPENINTESDDVLIDANIAKASLRQRAKPVQ